MENASFDSQILVFFFLRNKCLYRILGVNFQIFKEKLSASVSWSIPFTLIKVTFNNEENRTPNIGTTLARWALHWTEQAAETRASAEHMMSILTQLHLQSQVNDIIQFHLNVCFAISHGVIPMKRSQFVKQLGRKFSGLSNRAGYQSNYESLDKLSQGLRTMFLTVIRG